MYYNPNVAKFSMLKPKTKNIVRYNDYLEIMLEHANAIIDIDFNDSGIDKFPFLKYLIDYGIVGVARNEEDGELYFGNVVKGGSSVNKNGILEISAITTPNGKTIRSDKIAKIKLLNSGNPLWVLSRFADQLAEVDKSQEVLVLGTRLGNVLSVEDEYEKTQIDKAYENVRDGELVTYVKSKNLFSDNDNMDKIVPIGDPAKFQSMEYLSAYHSELIRRIFTLFGFSMSQKNKQAQVSEDELDDAELPSIIFIKSIIENLKKGVDEVNELFEAGWTIKANEILSKQFHDAMITNEDLKKGDDEDVAENENDAE